VAAMSAPTSAATSTPKKIAVRPRTVFTDTGILLQRGEWVTINASGEIKFGDGPLNAVKPTGIAWGPHCVTTAGARPQTRRWPAPGLRCWSLIGRIGTRPPFQIGTRRAFRAGSSGKLFLGINNDYLAHDSGTWSATVGVARTAPAPTTTVLPATTTTTTTPVVPNPSGAPMPVGDLPGWHQVFADDFTSSAPLGSFSGCSASNSILTSHCSGLSAAADAKWWAYPDGWKDTTGNGTYEPSQVISIGNGMMDLYLHTANGIHMVSAPVPKIPGATGPGGGVTSGRFSIRFRAGAVPGYKTAWLLWPDTNVWPRDGEIDFPEADLNNTIDAFMHRQGGSSGSDQDAYLSNATYAGWHTATIDWRATACTFILDDKVIGTSTSNIPATPMHWVLQTETSLDQPAPNSSAAGHVQIDWVTAYAPTNP
jgi:Glycosyl hydrolases family 16